MSKKTKKADAENPETLQNQPQTEQANVQPAYVRELLEKGVSVLIGRSRGELDEMLAAIPSDIAYYAGPVAYYYDKGQYRIQINKKED